MAERRRGGARRLGNKPYAVRVHVTLVHEPTSN